MTSTGTTKPPRPPAQKPKRPSTFWLTAETRKRLKRAARQRRTSASSLVEQLLAEAFADAPASVDAG